jgi:branched-chain amino acid transport system permease protein
VELHRYQSKTLERAQLHSCQFYSQVDMRLGVVLGYVKHIMKRFRLLILIATILCLLALPILLGDSTVISMAVEVLLLIAAAVSWNIFSGFTGYISLGNATYYGIGAYILALGVQDWHISGGFGPFLLLPLAGLVAGIFSIPLGWIALRTRRFTFIVITIAIFFIFQSLAYNLQNLTGGSEGIFLPIPDWSANLFNLPFYFVASTFVLLVTLISWWIRHSKYGLVLLAIRDDEDRVLGLGIPTKRYMLGVYVLSATFTGLVGALAIYLTGFINPSTAFDTGFDLSIVTISFLGGIGTVIGPIVGGLLLGSLQTILVQQYAVVSTGINQILLGGILLVVILLLPEGIMPSLRKRWRMWLASRFKLQSQVESIQVPSFSAVTTHISESFDLDDENNMKEQIVSAERSSKAAWTNPHIPSRQSVILQPSMGESQKMKAQRLVAISTPKSMTRQEPVTFDPVISWRCPFCRRPFLLKGNTCYCPRCSYTRPLIDENQRMLPPISAT